MNRYSHKVRKPVRRPSAGSYLLVTLLTFAFTISVTRLFLELAGYPQLGGEDLHIAHVLWGGLVLTFAAILPLIISNRWAFQLTAVLSGVGAGLFMDELGKFISRNNDYFFPIAAPIIYAFFLIGVLVYLMTKSPPRQSARNELYSALELLEEYLDHDLDPKEYAELIERLDFAARQDKHTHLARFATSLSSLFQEDDLDLVPASPKHAEKLQARVRAFEDRHLTQSRLRTLLSIGLLVLGSFAAGTAIIAFLTVITPSLVPGFLATRFVPIDISRNHWFLATHAMQGGIGIALIISGVMLLKKHPKEGGAVACFALITYLTVIDVLLFYFYQFSTIISALLQFTLLMGVIRYRNRHLHSPGSRLSS